MQTVDAMKVMGINDDDISSVFKIISATLLFGNIGFKQERNSDQVILFLAVRQIPNECWDASFFIIIYNLFILTSIKL